MKRLAAATLLPVLLSCLAYAQELQPPYVESTGEATVYGIPTHADFWFQARRTAATLAEAMTAAQQFESQVRARLTESELKPTEFEVTTPAVGALGSDQRDSVFVAARLRFPLSAYQNNEEGPQQFAQVCDKLKALATTVDAELEGPSILTANQKPLLQTAVAAAAENAYPAAEALAGTLKNSIYAVDSMQIEEVVWNQPRDGVNAEPTIRQISCMVRVRALYVLSQQ